MGAKPRDKGILRSLHRGQVTLDEFMAAMADMDLDQDREEAEDIVRDIDGYDGDAYLCVGDLHDALTASGQQVFQ